MSEEAVQEGFGRILAEARAAKGMSVADISEKLKLTVRQVEALEAEDYSRLPSAVFVRGFARNYARLLGISVDALPGVSEPTVEPTNTITAPSEDLVFRTSPVRRWLILPLAGVVLFLALVAALYNWLRRGEDAYLTNTAPVAQPAVPATIPLPPEKPAASAALSPAPVTPAQPAESGPAPTPPLPDKLTIPATAPAMPAKTAPVPPGATPGSQSQPATAAAPASGAPSSYALGSMAAGQHAVHFAVQDADSWVEVTTADQKRYAKLLHAGEQLTVHGAQPLKVVVGNAAHVQITYDDKPINLQPYTGEKVARLTLQ